MREIRPVTDDEFPDFMRAAGVAFGAHSTPEDIEDDRLVGELDRSLAVIEAGEIVGTAGAYSFGLTVPGPLTVPAAGVTWVGVLPTHRRRGILTDLMRRQLDDVAERGESIAILTASEGTIYRRFGYGVASRTVNVEITRARAAFRRPPAAGGRIRLVGMEEGLKVMPAIYEAFRRQRVGAVTRNERYWELWSRDRDRWRDGASAQFIVLHESTSGDADGFATYRYKEEWTQDEPRSQVRAYTVATTDPEVEAALWAYLLDIDLTATVKGHYRPVDDHLAHRLVDHRAYRQLSVDDWLWACLVDVPAALAARRYGVDGSLVVEVDDPFRPAAGGRFALQGGPDGAECGRTDAEADLAIAMPDLGAAYLGGTRFSVLHRAGLVEERTPGAVARADALFATDPLPYCNTGF